MLRSSTEPSAITVLDAELREILAEYPDVYEWLHVADKKRYAEALIEIDSIAQRIRIDLIESEEAADDAP